MLHNQNMFCRACEFLFSFYSTYKFIFNKWLHFRQGGSDEALLKQPLKDNDAIVPSSSWQVVSLTKRAAIETFLWR